MNYQITIDDEGLTLIDEHRDTCEYRAVRLDRPDEIKTIIDAWAREYPLDAAQAKEVLQAFLGEQALLAKLAQDAFGIPTLEARNSDGLDFHEVSVWSLKKALRSAYQAGRQHRTA